MSIHLSFEWLRVGYCQHLECMIERGAAWRKVAFPNLCGLIRHPTKGWILYDTGYASHFFDGTSEWPQALYRLSLPVTLPHQELLLEQLADRGLAPEDIQWVIVSHYHGDHVSGLKDFPKATLLSLKEGVQELMQRRTRPWRATLAGQLPELLPSDFMQRHRDVDQFPVCTLPRWMAPFHLGYDLLGDGSLVGVPLAGHAKGQLGLFMPDANGRPAFLLADACWSLPACLKGKLPSRLTRFVASDTATYERTFFDLRQLGQREPEVALLPSHCQTTWQAYREVHS